MGWMKTLKRRCCVTSTSEQALLTRRQQDVMCACAVAAFGWNCTARPRSASVSTFECMSMKQKATTVRVAPTILLVQCSTEYRHDPAAVCGLIWIGRAANTHCD